MLLPLSLSFLPLALILPQSWLPMCLLGYVAYRARNDSPPDTVRVRWRSAMWLCATPLIALGLGTVFTESARERQPALLGALWTLGAIHLGIALWLTWKSRPATGRMFLLSSAAVAWMASVIAVGTMAITGHWL